MNQGEKQTIVENAVEVIKTIVTVLVLVAWAIIGLVLWIPLLTRMIAYFVGVITASAFRTLDTHKAMANLNFAIEFYINGFRRILAVIHRTDSEDTQPPALDNTEFVGIVDFLKSVATDLIWAIVFWAVVLIRMSVR